MKQKKLFALLLSVFIFVCSTAWADISLSVFTDPVLSEWMGNTFDTGWDELVGFDEGGLPIYENRHADDGILSGQELLRINEFKELNCQGMNIKSLNGIEYLPNLETVNCSGCPIEEISFNNIAKIKGLICRGCDQLKSIEIRDCRALEYVYADESSSLRAFDCRDSRSMKRVSLYHCEQLIIVLVSDCKALERLDCQEGGKLTTLDLSGCIYLQELYCYDNPISLDIEDCRFLETIWCSDNQFTNTTLKNCIHLNSLICYDLTKTELDLSNCYASFHIDNGLSRAEGLKFKMTSEGCEVNMRDYVTKPENIISMRDNIEEDGGDYFSLPGDLISFDKATGIAVFRNPFSTLYYEYDTGASHKDGTPVVLNVELKGDPLVVTALERGEINTDGIPRYINIISDMTDNSYLDEWGGTFGAYGEIDREHKICTYDYASFGKLGFAADGNSRLIIRVQNEKPGTVSFSVDDIGAKLETFSRKEISPSDKFNMTQMQENWYEGGVYQYSVVLVAPETYPFEHVFLTFASPDLALPKTFNVHVKFTDEDGNTEAKNLELKIVHAPVILIPPLFGSRSSFSTANFDGVYRILKMSNFEVDVYRYNGFKGLSYSNAIDLRSTLWSKFNEYYEKRITCTRADIVGYGTGGLIAEYFCGFDPSEYDENEWSVISYRQKMIRRVIALATPHYGTPWAIDYADLTGKTDKVIRNLKFIMMNLTFENFFKINPSDIFAGLTKDVRYELPSGVPIYAIYGNAKGSLQRVFSRIGKIASYAGIIGLKEAKDPRIKIISGIITVVGFAAALGEDFIATTIDKYIFDNQEHDLVVSVPSAVGGLTRAVSGFTGWNYMHSNIGKQPDVGEKIVSLLEGPVSNFEIINNSNSRSAPEMVQNASANSEKSSDTENGFNFIETIKLNISPATFKAATDTPVSVTFTVTADKSMSEDIYCVINIDDDDSAIFMIPSTDIKGGKFEGKISFTSEDKGSMKAYCFSHNPNDTDGNSLYVSNIVRITAVPSLDGVNITGINFAGNSVYTYIRMETPAGLYATDDAGNYYDISSPLTGTKWTSNEYAMVRENGCIYGLMSSTTTLVATFGEFSASIDIHLEPNPFPAEPEEYITPPLITKLTPPKAIKNSEYNFALTAYSESSVRWSAKKLPDGLSIDPETGVISGTPTKAKTSTFTVTAENESGKTSESFSISVYELPSIITASVKEGTVNKTYSSKFKANGSKPITWSATGLPNGLSINPDNGTISGATSAFGTFPLTITATNPAGSDEAKVNLIIHAIPPKISGKFAAGFLSEYYSSTITLSKETEPIEWTLEGDLPEGLTFDTRTATLSGTPAQTWNGSLVVTASNDAGVAQKAMSLKIKGTSPKISGKFEKGNLNEPYSSALTLSKGTLPVKFNFEGNLPNGLNFNLETLTLSGTPTELWNDYITVTVTNGAGSYSKAFKIQVKGTAPKILTSGLPVGTVNENYDFELEATGSNPITWTAENLPDGLSLNGNRIEGTPSEEYRNLKITVRASNPVKTVSKTFRLTVNEAVVEETSSPAPEEISDKSEEIKPDENISEEKIIFGAERDVSSVNMTVISEDYEIVAVLPEIHVTKSGMYEINVELNETIEAGRELIWLAFPKNSEPSEDDKIAEFYDEEGNEITEVPENHKITVSAWFNEGVIYEPVVAVK